MEQEYKWNELDQTQQFMVCASHSHALGLAVDDPTTGRVFNLGCPDVVIGDRSGKPYCLVAPQSSELMKLLFRQYVTR